MDAALMLDLSQRLDRGEWLAIAGDRVPLHDGRRVWWIFLATRRLSARALADGGTAALPGESAVLPEDRWPLPDPFSNRFSKHPVGTWPARSDDPALGATLRRSSCASLCLLAPRNGSTSMPIGNRHLTVATPLAWRSRCAAAAYCTLTSKWSCRSSTSIRWTWSGTVIT
jgi:hypothetical protein